jgi:translation elongation factor EF-4
LERACCEYTASAVQPKKPQANSMAERFIGRIKEVVQQTCFESTMQCSLNRNAIIRRLTPKV